MIKSSDISFRLEKNVEESNVIVLGVKPAVVNSFCNRPSELLVASSTIPCKYQRLKVKRKTECKKFLNLTYKLPNESRKRVFDLNKFGCPIIVKNGESLRLNLELWINNNFAREIDGEYVLYELNNRKDFKVS